ncbi:hypothetical protein HW130_23570 [Streptomyces sp. PKU-EA00015]|uniref:hypothetical protein n=1 Tax=Streptomyces sp. PKU-EA00015 TaxID=2748326 RepID=UPI0015A32BC8|nr:hypothetical protein [Streptomyces sp. PKU-EA00015]NWF29196.1 hypothetical protein [Streptomyces sp. PKU-EA00015]
MGLQLTRILELTTNDVAVQEATVLLKLDGTHLQLPPRLAQLVLKHLEHAQSAWDQPCRRHHPMAVRRSERSRAIQSRYIYLKIRRLGLGSLAGRNATRLALAADVPASILAVLTGTIIDNATDWANFVKRNWTGYIASRRNDS